MHVCAGQEKRVTVRVQVIECLLLARPCSTHLTFAAALASRHLLEHREVGLFA